MRKNEGRDSQLSSLNRRKVKPFGRSSTRYAIRSSSKTVEQKWLSKETKTGGILIELNQGLLESKALVPSLFRNPRSSVISEKTEVDEVVVKRE